MSERIAYRLNLKQPHDNFQRWKSSYNDSSSRAEQKNHITVTHISKLLGILT